MHQRPNEYVFACFAGAMISQVAQTPSSLLSRKEILFQKVEQTILEMHCQAKRVFGKFVEMRFDEEHQRVTLNVFS
jgi:hypothetical protein